MFSDMRIEHGVREKDIYSYVYRCGICKHTLHTWLGDGEILGAKLDRLIDGPTLVIFSMRIIVWTLEEKAPLSLHELPAVLGHAMLDENLSRLGFGGFPKLGVLYLSGVPTK